MSRSLEDTTSFRSGTYRRTENGHIIEKVRLDVQTDILYQWQ